MLARPLFEERGRGRCTARYAAAGFARKAEVEAAKIGRLLSLLHSGSWGRRRDAAARLAREAEVEAL